MDRDSRRRFLAAGLALPAVGMATPQRPAAPAPQPAPAQAGKPTLTYRELGKTGLKVTTLGFGCMVTSDPSVIERAAAIGINYFDTARGYQSGNNERMVGAALKGRRNSIVLSSKTAAPNKEGALAHLDTSLKELGTDHLDIWYLHAKSTPAQVTDDLIEAQQIAKQAGKIRFAGVSTHGGQPELIPALIAKGQHDIILTSYNFTMSPDMAPLIESARKAGIGIVAMKVMAGGYRRLQPTERNYQILSKDGAMLAALKWVIRNKNVDTTIPSMTDMDQLDENLKAMTAGYTQEDERVLAAQLEYIRPMYCSMCGECNGTCKEGLPVADVLRYLTYSEGYGQYALGRQNFLELPAKLIQVRCEDCDACTVQCPHGVHVAKHVARAQEVFA